MAKIPSPAQLKRLGEARAEEILTATGETEPHRRAMRVDKAIRCCEIGQLEALELVDTVVAHFLELGRARPEGVVGDILAFVPATASLPAAIERFAGAPVRGGSIAGLPAAAVAVGGAMLIGWTGLLSIAGNLGANNLANAVLTLTSELRDRIRQNLRTNDIKNRGACYKCAMRNAWPQFPQKRQRIVNDKGIRISRRLPVPKQTPTGQTQTEVRGDVSTIPLPP